MAEDKKIIIDEDLKQQAKKEKENLAAKEKTETKQSKDEKKGQKHRGPLPEGDFAGLLSMLVTQTLFALGYLTIEGQEKKEPDLQIAKYNIEILQTLEDKTKGNLTDEESTALKNMLSQVRMAYVKAAE
jgi:hypothetical protein